MRNDRSTAATVPGVSGADLDVRALRCPMTWIRTKLALERLAPGDVLTVRCSPGEALENVPRSAREAGHAATVEGTTVKDAYSLLKFGYERNWPSDANPKVLAGTPDVMQDSAAFNPPV